MAGNGTIKINDISELYSLLPEELREEFSIGMHEFREVAGAAGRPLELTGKWDENRIEMVKKSILSQGLKFDEDSILLSTVMFDESSFSKYISGEVTKLGGVIVALPKVLRSESGESMFVGQPNEDGIFRDRYDYNEMRYNGWDRRTEATSLSELVIPDTGVLNPMFIIGTYSKTGKGIEISLNPEHIAFKDGRVPDDFFKQKKDKLSEVVGNLGEFALKETLSQQESYKGKKDFTVDFRDVLSSLVDEYLVNISNDGIGEVSEDDIRDTIAYVRLAGLNDKADEIQKRLDAMIESNEKNQQQEEIRDPRSYHEEQQSRTEKTMHTQTGIAQDKVDKIRMAIEEMRAAGLDDELITTYMIKGAKGRLGSVEQLGIIGQIKGKYGVNEILEEDFFAHNQSQSEEMRQAINGIIQPLSELEKRRIQRKDDMQIEDVSMEDVGISSTPIQEEGAEGMEYVQPETSKRKISQETMDRLRVAIQDARRQGLDGEAIKKYIYKNQAVRGVNGEDRKKWIEISSKHGIDEIMWNDYYGDSSYTGHSSEMYDAIDMLTEEEIVSLTELGEKSYKHFGSKIAEKLKEAVNALKSRFFSKDKGKEDMTNGR